MREEEKIERLTEADMPGFTFIKKIRALLDEEVPVTEKEAGAAPKAIPAEVREHYNRAQGLEANNQFGKVLETLLEAIELAPNCARCWSAFAPSLLRMGWRNDAERVAKRALELDENSPKIWADYGGLLLNLRKTDAAIKALERCVELEPNNDYAWLNLGGAHLSMKNYDGAVNAWTEATKSNPKQAGAWFNLGSLLDGLGRKADAEAAYAKFIELRPQDGPKAVAIARQAVARGRRGQGQPEI
jgi:tetratricopeptide (TPR) repeat protein